MINRLWNQALRERASAFTSEKRPSATPFLKLVRDTRQKHLKLWQEDINNFLNLGNSFRTHSRFRPQPGLYDLQAVDAEDTGTSTSSTTSLGTYEIDPASLGSVLSGTLYTINGVVSGLAGTQTLIRVWRGDPNTGLKYFDSNRNEVLVYSAPLIDLPSGSTTFSLAFDTSQIPANVPQPLSVTNPWLISASGPTGGQPESDTLQVPLPTTAAVMTASFSIDSGTVMATQSGTNMMTITGTAREPNSTSAVARVWKGDSSGNKSAPAPMYKETLIGTSNPITMAGGAGTFTINIDLSLSPAKDNLPTAANPYVITLCDTFGGNEMLLPTTVPPIGFVAAGAAMFTIDAGSVKATQSGNFLTITGTAREPNSATTVARVWKGKSDGSKYDDPVTFAETLIGTSNQTTLSGGVATFTVVIDLSQPPASTNLPTSTNPYVVTLCDTIGGNEMWMPSLVPLTSTLAPTPTTPTPVPTPTPTPVSTTLLPAPSMGNENIESIQGIGGVIAPKFRAAGVHTTGDLLNAAGTKSQRAKLAKATGFTTEFVLDMANRADLARVVGLGPEWSDLLEASGIDTVVELARRNPTALLQRITEVNAGHKPNPFVRQLPAASQVASWVTSAKSIPRVLKY